MPVTDARSLAKDSLIEGDIVIIGGGIAGLTIAHEFAGTATRVVILESGGPEPDPQNQTLYEGTGAISGPAGSPELSIDEYLSSSRVRALGGGGHRWGGKCGPLEEADFAHRPWWPLSGWPFGRRELKLYYDRACDRMKIPHFPVDDGPPDGQTLKPIGAAGGALRSPPRTISPLSINASGGDRTNFLAFRDTPGRSANIDIHTNVNVTGIRLGKDGAVDRLELRCLNGARHAARGGTYVLATGGIENARLLLASNADRPEGVGNATGWVGRCFLGHVEFNPGNGALHGAELVFTTPDDLSLYDDNPLDRPHAVLALDLATQKRLGLGNCTLKLFTKPKPPAAGDTTSAAVEQLASAVEKTAGRRGRYVLMPEAAPNRDSRVVLADETDALGQRRAGLEWRFSETDWKSLAASARGLGGVLGGQGLGRLRWSIATEDLLYSMRTANHHMGTTRMAVDPAQGVVDADCRVHGTANLYIAGSSVFPTSGLVNPTLTLTALAIRLADHLKIKGKAG